MVFIYVLQIIDRKHEAAHDFDSRSLYDYNELVDEYDQDTSKEAKSIETYRPIIDGNDLPLYTFSSLNNCTKVSTGCIHLCNHFLKFVFFSGDPKINLLNSLKTLTTFDTEVKNCTAEELSQIGFKAIYCLYSDYKNNRHNPRVLTLRLWRIARVWFYVYVVVAIPLWCTKGPLYL